MLDVRGPYEETSFYRWGVCKIYALIKQIATTLQDNSFLYVNGKKSQELF